MKVYVGWDQKDAEAYDVLKRSILRNNYADIRALKDWELRQEKMYWRPYRVTETGQMIDDQDGLPFSTNFAFTRFLVPALENFNDEWVLFCDADFIFRAPINELFSLIDDSKAVMVVQHNHIPVEERKMDGISQGKYFRKNWSSLMLMNPSKCKNLTPETVSGATGRWLHGFHWLKEEEIGSLPEEWNWLEGHSSMDLEPKAVHFTRGGPWMKGYEDVPYSDEWFKLK